MIFYIVIMIHISQVAQIDKVFYSILDYLNPEGPDIVSLCATNSEFKAFVKKYCNQSFNCDHLLLRFGNFYSNKAILQYYWTNVKNYFESNNLLKEHAIKTGNMNLLEWCIAKKCGNINITDIEKAAERGHLEIIEWLYMITFKDFPHSSICNHAAISGHLHIIQWFHSKGYRMSIETFTNAAMGAHINILNWAVANGYILDDEVFCKFALNNCNSNVADWIGQYQSKNSPITE